MVVHLCPSILLGFTGFLATGKPSSPARLRHHERSKLVRKLQQWVDEVKERAAEITKSLRHHDLQLERLSHEKKEDPDAVDAATEPVHQRGNMCCSATVAFFLPTCLMVYCCLIVESLDIFDIIGRLMVNGQNC